MRSGVLNVGFIKTDN